jgi:hypothetical protein
MLAGLKFHQGGGEGKVLLGGKRMDRKFFNREKDTITCERNYQKKYRNKKLGENVQ